MKRQRKTWSRTHPNGAYRMKREEQTSLFDDNGADDAPIADLDNADVGELQRDIHRMTLATSSGVYARRREI